DALAELVRHARRPMLWLGGGARDAGGAAVDLAERGFAVVCSANGRAVVPEAHRHTLGAFNMTPQAQAIYDRADLMIGVGSRLRGNEPRNNAMRLPRPLVQIDADAGQAARNYAVDLFVNADARSALEGLCERLPAKLDVDPKFLGDVAAARAQSEEKLAAAPGPYRPVAPAPRARVAQSPPPFVRDLPPSHSTLRHPHVPFSPPPLPPPPPPGAT